MRAFGLVLVLASAAACRSLEKRFNDISVGMTKVEVVERVGTPDTTAAKYQREFLIYNLAPDDREALKRREWYVCLEEGHVVSFGRVGDFDSAKLKSPEQTLNVNWLEKQEK